MGLKSNKKSLQQRTKSLKNTAYVKLNLVDEIKWDIYVRKNSAKRIRPRSQLIIKSRSNSTTFDIKNYINHVNYN